MRKHLQQVNMTCLKVTNAALTAQEAHVPYALTSAIDNALDAVLDAMKRLEQIDRHAPS